MTKAEIHQQFIAQLTTELAGVTEAAKNSIAIATNDEHSAESKYDTFSLETSYLARGQAKRVEELSESLALLKSMPLEAVTRVQLGALVRLRATDGEHRCLFFCPSGGGEEIEQDGETIVIVTPISPLGRAVVGKQAGNSCTLGSGLDEQVFTIQSVE